MLSPGGRALQIFVRESPMSQKDPRMAPERRQAYKAQSDNVHSFRPGTVIEKMKWTSVNISSPLPITGKGLEFSP